MIYQQVTSAVRRSYADHPDVATNAARAQECRDWIESLDIDASVRASLVEPFQVLYEAFAGLDDRRSKPTAV
jgi:hypothetical protein